MSRVLVAGGAGFLGSHLCDALLDRGDEVVCMDDFSTGVRANVAHLAAHPGFEVVEADVSRAVPMEGTVDAVVNLASPASPPAYLARPLETLAAGSEGTRRLLDVAERCGARFLLASTSEIYGEPEVHPQVETYRGNVDPTGPRSVYDEAKRFAEALTMASHRARGTDVAIARIFNTYGPRLAPGDGRVVSNFVSQAIRGVPLTVYGDGTQTRSFCYVTDLVAGLVALLDARAGAGAGGSAGAGLTGPINLGNPDERTVLALAHAVLEAVGTGVGAASKIEFRALPLDDPTRRCPDITLARELLGWEPTITLREGLACTVEYLAGHMEGVEQGRTREAGVGA